MIKVALLYYLPLEFYPPTTNLINIASKDKKLYLRSLNINCISYFEEGIEYDSMPIVLKKYDVGVILYKALSDIYKFNAQNKLFEYLACGLTVWRSSVKSRIKPYLCSKVLSLDFEKLFDLNLDNTKFINSTESNSIYFAEEAVKSLINKLVE